MLLLLLGCYILFVIVLLLLFAFLIRQTFIESLDLSLLGIGRPSKRPPVNSKTISDNNNIVFSPLTCIYIRSTNSPVFENNELIYPCFVLKL